MRLQIWHGQYLHQLESCWCSPETLEWVSSQSDWFPKEAYERLFAEAQRSGFHSILTFKVRVLEPSIAQYKVKQQGVWPKVQQLDALLLDTK